MHNFYSSFILTQPATTQSISRGTGDLVWWCSQDPLGALGLHDAGYLSCRMAVEQLSNLNKKDSPGFP